MKTILVKLLRYISIAYLGLLFNGELYAHGLRGLVLIPLVAFYFVFTFFIGQIIKRTKLKPIHIFFIGSLIGLLLETFYTKSLFQHPILFGVNWLSVCIQILYYGMAAILPFYVVKTMQDKSYSENTFLNILICLYLVIQFVLGAVRFYPTPTWIITGLPLGIVTLTHLIKKKNISLYH